MQNKIYKCGKKITQKDLVKLSGQTVLCNTLRNESTNKMYLFKNVHLK